MAITKEHVVICELHRSSAMDQAIPVEDQAVRKRKTRQETVILTWGVSHQSAGGWKVEVGRWKVSLPGSESPCLHRR